MSLTADLAESDPQLVVTPDDFLIRHSADDAEPLAVVASVPHYGVGSPRVYDADEFETHLGLHLAFGFVDDYAPQLYGDLHRMGAQLVATRLSRLFVDVNRPRDDFKREGDHVHSRTGVIRTHSRRGTPIFTTPPTVHEAELRLEAFYDPYYAALEYALEACVAEYGRAVLLDLHTASAQRMGDHEVVLGTSRGRTAGDELVDRMRAIFESYGWRCDVDVPGYAGANIVRSFGAHEREDTEAVQIEISAGLLQTMAYDDFVRTQIGGRRPAPDAGALSRLRDCIAEVVRQSDAHVRS